MAKQGHSKENNTNKNNNTNDIQTSETAERNFNKTTIFLTHFLFDVNFEAIKKCGFVDSYTSDPDKIEIFNLTPEKRFLFLLFRNKKLSVEEIANITKVLAIYAIKIPYSYELVNDYCMLVIEFPQKYIPDYDFVVQGRYSKLSKEYKQSFPETRDVFNSKNQRLGKEYTIYHHIFNKTPWLKDYWMKKLNLVELDDGMELWQQPGKKDLEFDIQNIFKP